MRAATQALTVLAEIDPARRALLETRLTDIAADLEHNPVFRPGELPDTHFMRFVIIDDHELPALLAWESNHDGYAVDYLDEVARSGAGLDAVFECCTGYPGTADAEVWRAWMQARAHRAAAFYTAYRGVPRRQVLNDRAIRDTLRDALDAPGARARLQALPGSHVQRLLCEHVRATRPDLDTCVQDDRLRWLIGKAVAIAGVLVLLPLLLVLAGPWYLVLRAKERADAADPPARPARPVHDDKRLALREDDVRQNQLTHVVDIKPGWFRYATLWVVLTAIDVVARVYSVKGDLGGITSIHFARWVIVRDRRDVPDPRHRLVFFSNYDGSWESYLGEFIDRAAYGLTGVWSNTVEFPVTRSLLGAGARDEEAFKQWTRDHQIPTQVWWSGIRDSTVQNVLDDIAVRRGLDRAFADDEVATWLRKL